MENFTEEYIQSKGNDKDAHDIWVSVCKKDGVAAADRALDRYFDLFGQKPSIFSSSKITDQ